MDDLPDNQSQIQPQAEEYVLGIQNPAQLISSLSLMLREQNYLSLYDTSILCSPEPHLKKASFEELNRDYLYKWSLFFSGMERNFQAFENLIIINEVVEEMQNLIAGTLSAIDKRKGQFKSFSAQQKNCFQNIYEQLLRNEEALHRIQEQLQKYRSKPGLSLPNIFVRFLDFIKILDGSLELKKPSSRNDTDERICARAFYELAVNSFNVAVYTRDDDIRKLISATYKFLTSKLVSEEFNLAFLKKFSHLNIVVLKYNYEKHVFSRFFESSTEYWAGDFRFPPKLSKNKVSQICEEIKVILQDIENELQTVPVPQPIQSEPTTPAVQITGDSIIKAVQNIFKIVCKMQVQQTIPNFRLKIDLLKHLTTLAQSQQDLELQEQICEVRKNEEQHCIQSMVAQLRQEQVELQKKFDQMHSKPQPQLPEYWKGIQETAEGIQENLLKLYFFETALKLNLHTLSEPDYQYFKELLAQFKQQGFLIEQSETPIPQDKISEIVQVSITDTIRIIEQYKIKYQSMHVYLSQANLLYFVKSKEQGK